MNEIFFSIIKKAKKTNKLIAIKTEIDDTDIFTAGYILEYNDEIIYLNSIDDNGLDDGVEIINVNTIYEIAVDDNYLNKLQLFVKNREKILETKDYKIKIKKSDTYFLDYLQEIKDKKQLVSFLFVYDFTISGFIEELDNEYINIKVVSEYGKEDGISCLQIKDIDRISVNSIYDKKIKLLYQITKNSLNFKN